MKTIKTTILKTTKSATKSAAKVSPARTPAASRAPKQSSKAEAKADGVPRVAPRREITSDLIAERAYIIWEQQGRPPGHDVANWLLAESQLKQEIQSFTA